MWKFKQYFIWLKERWQPICALIFLLLLLLILKNQTEIINSVSSLSSDVDELKEKVDSIPEPPDNSGIHALIWPKS